MSSNYVYFCIWSSPGVSAHYAQFKQGKTGKAHYPTHKKPHLRLPASTKVFAVPALSSYSLRRSSTLAFFMLSFRGLMGGARAGGLLDVSKEGILCSSPGEIARGFGPGTGSDVDLEGGRFVTGCAEGYTGRAREVMFGALLADAGQLGLRNSFIGCCSAMTDEGLLSGFGASGI